MQYEDISNIDERLDHLFLEYRDACGAPELSANFRPALWQKIETRQSSSWIFRKVSGWFVAASAAASVALALALFSTPSISPSSNAGTYVDALAADHVADYALYTEPVHVDNVADYSAGRIVE
jgi:anti-sigma-K factor RskA